VTVVVAAWNEEQAIEATVVLADNNSTGFTYVATVTNVG
jgi:hypothetical protein